eukprot:scaffold6589_cov116-Isochrysis_galbana.AAC.6
MKAEPRPHLVFPPPATLPPAGHRGGSGAQLLAGDVAQDGRGGCAVGQGGRLQVSRHRRVFGGCARPALLSGDEH